MATARQRSGLRGVGKLRRTLRRIEQGSDSRIKPVMTQAAQAIHADMLAMVPVGTGQLAQLLSYRVSPDGLTARIGLVTRRAQRDGFYGRFIEHGTKGSEKRNIPPQPARPFMAPAFDANAGWAVDNIRAAISMVIREAAAGTAGADDE